MLTSTKYVSPCGEFVRFLSFQTFTQARCCRVRSSLCFVKVSCKVVCNFRRCFAKKCSISTSGQAFEVLVVITEEVPWMSTPSKRENVSETLVFALQEARNEASRTWKCPCSVEEHCTRHIPALCSFPAIVQHTYQPDDCPENALKRSLVRFQKDRSSCVLLWSKRRSSRSYFSTTLSRRQALEVRNEWAGSSFSLVPSFTPWGIYLGLLRG